MTTLNHEEHKRVRDVFVEAIRNRFAFVNRVAEEELAKWSELLHYAFMERIYD